MMNANVFGTHLLPFFIAIIDKWDAPIFDKDCDKDCALSISKSYLQYFRNLFKDNSITNKSFTK